MLVVNSSFTYTSAMEALLWTWAIKHLEVWNIEEWFAFACPRSSPNNGGSRSSGSKQIVLRANCQQLLQNATTLSRYNIWMKFVYQPELRYFWRFPPPYPSRWFQLRGQFTSWRPLGPFLFQHWQVATRDS